MMSVTDVADRLEEAAYTLRRMPKVGVPGFKSTWPAVVREFMDAYGWESAHVRLGPPPARKISEMDEALRWLLWLDLYESKLVWMRACRVPWKVISYKLKRSRTAVCIDWKTAIMKICFTLRSTNLNREYPYRNLLTASVRKSGGRSGRNLTQKDIGLRNVCSGLSKAKSP